MVFLTSMGVTLKIEKKDLRKGLVIGSLWLITTTSLLGFIRTGSLEREREEAIDQALLISRQVAAQAETLLLNARVQPEKDPLGWVSYLLSQGFEPRAYRVKRLNTPPESGEELQIDPSKKLARYFHKMPIPNRLPGFNVDDPVQQKLRDELEVWFSIETNYMPRYFLGANSRLKGDFLFLVLWCLLQIPGVFLTLSVLRPIRTNPELKRVIGGWTRDAKLILIQMGAHIRDFLKEAQVLVQVSKQSKESLQAVGGLLKEDTQKLREFKEMSELMKKTATQLETVSLNLILDSSRLGEEGAQMIRMIEEIHRLAQTLRKTSERTEVNALRMAKNISPLLEETQKTLEIFNEIFSVTKNIDESVSRTTETLVQQAKLIQTVNQSLDTEIKAA